LSFFKCEYPGACALRLLPLKSLPMEKTQNALPPDIAKMSFEEALAELESLVKRLEDGRAKLEDAIGFYERGAMLKRACEAKLREAQARIEQISLSESGPSLSPVNIQ